MARLQNSQKLSAKGMVVRGLLLGAKFVSAYQYICCATDLEVLVVESLTSMHKLNILLPLGCYMTLTSHLRSAEKHARGGEKCGES